MEDRPVEARRPELFDPHRIDADHEVAEVIQGAEHRRVAEHHGRLAPPGESVIGAEPDENPRAPVRMHRKDVEVSDLHVDSCPASVDPASARADTNWLEVIDVQMCDSIHQMIRSVNE